MTHNENDAKFTVPQMTDKSKVGVYTFIVRSEIKVPNDYNMNSFTPMTSE